MGEGSGGFERMHRPGRWSGGGRSSNERSRQHVRSGRIYTPKEIKQRIAEALKLDSTSEEN